VRLGSNISVTISWSTLFNACCQPDGFDVGALFCLPAGRQVASFSFVQAKENEDQPVMLALNSAPLTMWPNQLI